MAYKKTIWIDEETPLNANNMNNIENGISTNEAAISNINNNYVTKDTNQAITGHKIFVDGITVGNQDLFYDMYTTTDNEYAIDNKYGNCVISVSENNFTLFESNTFAERTITVGSNTSKIRSFITPSMNVDSSVLIGDLDVRYRKSDSEKTFAGSILIASKYSNIGWLTYNDEVDDTYAITLRPSDYKFDSDVEILLPDGDGKLARIEDIPKYYQHTVILRGYNANDTSTATLRFVFTAISKSNVNISSFTQLYSIFGGMTIAGVGGIFNANDATVINITNHNSGQFTFLAIKLPKTDGQIKFLYPGTTIGNTDLVEITRNELNLTNYHLQDIVVEISLP